MSDKRWISELHWRRKGQQTRSERTQSALLDAAESLILEKGTEATSIADIAARAGCSVGSVYHHFKDKQALYLAIFQRLTYAYQELNDRAADPDLWAGATIKDLLTGYIQVMLTSAKETSAAKAAVSAVVADHPELARHYAEIQARGRKAMLALVLERRAEIGAPDPDLAAAFAIDQVAAMVRARIDPAQRQAALGTLDDKGFTKNVVAMALAWLQVKTE